jgi:hypothetical protein
MSSREREIDRFLWCLALGPLLVLLALAVEQFLSPLVASQASGINDVGEKALATALHFTALLLAMFGSVLALVGAIRLTEWARLPTHIRQSRIRPWLKAIWTVAIAESFVLLLVSLVWIGL